MDTWQTVGTALGLGFLSGYRLYLTVFLAGLGFRLGWFQFEGSLGHLAILGDTRVLVAAGAACLLEFLADKIPWVDSMWDSLHTFVRPIGAALLASAASAEMDPAYRIILALLAGGIALSSHSSKAATRLAINHSPEPFSNISASLLGDMSVPLGVWVVFNHPLWALGGIVLFVALFVWLAPRVFRILRLEMVGIGALLGRIIGGSARELESVPAELGQAASDRLGFVPAQGLRCAAGRSIGGLKHSIGWLCPTDRALVFVTRRFFRPRVHVVDRAHLKLIGFERGLLLHRLTLDLGDREQDFRCFHGTPERIVDLLQSPRQIARTA